ncbi:MAG: CCA tRNA nucleotidyltransferase [Alphaproteobacteria bacterium]
MDRIEPQSWMRAPETLAVMKVLHDGGAAARFVGGCVRDALLHRPIRDIDIATDAPPERVMSLMREAGYAAVPTGVAHGTVTAVIGGVAFEVTTLRHDVETDGRHATVAFTGDWEADAARRDLTMNALSLEADGTLHDPFGGRADLLAGRVRFVGDPVLRITEDVLRLLRFFRFQAHYGKMPPDDAALAACRNMAPMLKTLSAERVRAELLKLLDAPDPVATLTLMRDLGVLAHFLPEASNIDRLTRLLRIEAIMAPADPLRRLAALLRVGLEGVKAIAGRLRLSNAERDYLAMSVRLDIVPPLDPAARRRYLYRFGVSVFRERVLLGWADAPDPVDADWRDLLAAAEDWRPVVFPLTGKDVLARDVPRGPDIGALLTAVEDWWIAGDFQADRQACLTRLDQEIASRR